MKTLKVKNEDYEVIEVRFNRMTLMMVIGTCEDDFIEDADA